MSLPSRDEDVVELRRVSALLRRQRWFMTAVLLLVVVVVSLVTAAQTSVYAAEARLALEPVAERDDVERTVFGALDVRAQAELFLADPAIADRLDVPAPVRAAAGPLLAGDGVQAAFEPGVSILTITVEHEDPELAASLATALAKEYLATVTAEAQERVSVALRRIASETAALQARLDSLEQQLRAPAATRASLETERDELFAQQRLLAEQAIDLRTTIDLARLGRLVAAAPVPSDPVRPNLPLNLALALVAGTLLAVGLALLRDFRGGRVRDEYTLADLGAAPVLGHVRDRTGDDLRRISTVLAARSAGGAGGIAVLPTAQGADTHELAAAVVDELRRSGVPASVVAGSSPAAATDGRAPAGAPPDELLLFTAPAASTADGLAAAVEAGRAVLVVEFGRSRKAEVRSGVDALTRVGVPLLGVIVADTSAGASSARRARAVAT